MQKKDKKLLKFFKESEKNLFLNTRPFSKKEAWIVYIKILLGRHKHLNPNPSDFLDRFNINMIEYTSGNYEVQSTYNTVNGGYYTRITHNSKNLDKDYAYRQMCHKRIQRLLHQHGQRLKQ